MVVAFGLLVLACREDGGCATMVQQAPDLTGVADGLKTIGFGIVGAAVVLVLAGLSRSSRY
ncbi:hypothetical protein KBB96_10310 [Luteolibacter ambystomatis]|uniref:Uncharacterized protein n=1 Tax=Luteolibacter ambystomatis TaxID=2824561 RepID=A0A975G5R2_9BACT|nr:hypothetical protein [Luteolibacter ambystomatis]QUE49266.1 hypothetical protein KBB96_10310 [Luteolibacter ambystomatis]